MTGMRWELAPQTEPVPRSGPRTSAGAFRADWDNTMRLLAEETGRLDAGLVLIEVDAPAEWLRRDRQGFKPGQPASPRSPGVRVRFTSKHGDQVYETDRYTTWRACVRAVALSLQMLRAVDRYGVSTGQQYTGFRPAIEAGPAAPAFETAREAIRWMMATLHSYGDDEGGAPDQVAKRLAKLLHPDGGGGPAEVATRSAEWALLQAAKTVLQAAGVL